MLRMPFAAAISQAVAIAAGQQRILALVAALPDRPHGMDHIAGLQLEAGGEPCLAGRAAADPGAGLGQLRPGGAVDGPADAGTRLEMPVGGIDDGVDIEGRDVALDDGDPFRQRLFGIAGMLRRIETHQPEEQQQPRNRQGRRRR